LKDLRKLLQVHSHDAMMRKLMELPRQYRDRWVLTYERKRSLWLGLNDFDLVCIKYEEQKVPA